MYLLLPQLQRVCPTAHVILIHAILTAFDDFYNLLGCKDQKVMKMRTVRPFLPHNLKQFKP